MEIPLLANLVLKEATVRILHPLREVAEEYECRDNRILKHSHILDFHEFTLIGGRRSDSYLLKHIGVELRGGDDTATVVIDLDSGLQHFEYTLLGEG